MLKQHGNRLSIRYKAIPRIINAEGITMKGLLYVAAAAFVLSLYGCNQENGNTSTGPDADNGSNEAPLISASTPADTTIDQEASGKLSFSVATTDPDNDPLTYKWSVSGGTIASNGSAQMEWTAPSAAGIQHVKVAVSDGKGHTVYSSWSVGVGIIHVQGALDAPTTWKTGNIYIVNNWVSVDATLTIESGVVVKFNSGAELTVSSEGTLTCAGTALAPIIFTSAKDDAGGDTNSDGSASKPAMNDWSGVYIQGNNSTIGYCKVLYSEDGLTVSNNSRSTVDHCIISHNKHGLDLTNAGVGTTFSNCSLIDNETPLFTNTNINLDDTSVYSNNTFQQISMVNGSVDYNIKWKTSGDVAIVIRDWVSVNSTLTLGSSTVLKFMQDASFTIESGGTVNGLDSAVFTSYKDDTRGGDSNGDGNASSPASGDWEGVWGAAGNDWIHPAHGYYAGNVAQ